MSLQYPRTISFIVLALNEEDHIEITFQTVLDAVAYSSIDAYEVVMVYDGSTDKTGVLMGAIQATSDKVKVIHNSCNKGLGAAYIRGIEVASNEYIMIIAGDNIMPTLSISKIVDLIGTHDMILPYMTDDQFREPIRRYGSSGFTWVINKMSGNKIKYYNGMVVRRSLFEGEKIDSTGYSLMAECVLKFLGKGADFIEVGVPHGYPVATKSGSKALRIKNLVNLFFSLLRIYRLTRQRH